MRQLSNDLNKEESFYSKQSEFLYVSQFYKINHLYQDFKG